MERKIEDLRNIGIIAHIDAGKTTVTERMLFCCGATHRLGEVDKGTAETDFDEEEQQRGITIYSACVTFQWKDVSVNLIDTPGHVDFTAEVERCLRVLDGGVVLFSAREGVEAQSETVWRQADKYHVPRIAFINKMDREGADFQGTLKEIAKRLKANPVVLQIPVGHGPAHAPDAFRGMIDLVSMEMLTYRSDEKGGQTERQEIPGELRRESETWRELMLEKLYDFSNELMERVLQEEEVSAELIRRVLREATLLQQIEPVLCGSALNGIGIHPLMDAIAYYLPSPSDKPPIEGINPKKKNVLERRKPSADEPFCGLVFKVVPAKTGDLTWVRVYSGQLKAGSRVYNTGKDKKENVPQLWHIQAARKQQVPTVATGDIVSAIGLRHSVTGDTLCDTHHPILLETIQFPETVISMAIEPESTTERKKLSETLQLMRRQDPTFRAVENEETGQTLINGMGELHLEVIKHRLLRDFNLDVKVHKPRVSYRESVHRMVQVTGECHRQVAGQQLFARLSIRLEPFGDGTESTRVVIACSDEAVPQSLLLAAVEELQLRCEGGGPLGGFPLMEIKVTVLGGEAHETGSNEVAFRIAAGDAFEKGLRQAGPVLLEPIMKLDISAPEEHLGEFVGDLHKRRSTIAKTEHRGASVQIEAHAPLAELFGYSSAMRSLSQGRASCSIEPLAYAPAPSEVVAGYL